MSRDRLSLIVFSGDYDRVHYALVMASAAAATNRPVTLFFTMGASKALLAPKPDGTTPGWAALSATDDGISASDRDANHAKAGIATLDELLEACVELDVTMWVCEMGLKAEELPLSDFRDDITVMESGMVTFLAESERENSRIVFI